MPFYVEHARQSQSSPSVSLEKGAYRLRAPAKRTARDPLPLPLRAGSPPYKDSPTLRYEKQMAVLVVFLICATVTCFGTAYYLFTTRWGSDASLQISPSNSELGLQVVDFNLIGSSGTSSRSGVWMSLGAGPVSEEKFRAYLPHNRLPSLCIALENALSAPDGVHESGTGAGRVHGA